MAIRVLLIVLSDRQIPAMVTSEKVMVADGSQLSVAVAVPVAAGNVLPVHNTVMFAGHVIAGPVLSSTKMVCVHVLELPQSSVAVHVLVMFNSWGQPRMDVEIQALARRL